MKFDIAKIAELFDQKTTSKTNNKEYDDEGFLVIKNLIDDISVLECDIPEKRGSYHYYGSLDKFDHKDIEEQVKGSVSRYYYPPYKNTYFEVKKKLEEIIGRKLYPTYYYDRFYFPGQQLEKHKDRDACEISVSVHISTNLKEPWNFWIFSKKNKPQSLNLSPGDGVLYKGCENIHWRSPMPGRKRNVLNKLFKKKEIYYHQIFFHYVLADGIRAHCAFDSSR